MPASSVFRIARTSTPTLSEVLIVAPRRWVPLNLAELWRHRELLYFMTWRDIKVRYKQTVLGAAWAIIQPLATVMVLSLFFGRMPRMTEDGIPYTAFAFAAFLPWLFFSNGLAHSANSLVGNSNLITKVYFPRLLIPLGSIVSGVIDLLLGFLVLAGLLAWYGIAPAPQVILLPLPTLLAVVTALGAGLWLSALNVQFRDVRHIVPFLCQLWMFATPVVYPISLLGGSWKHLVGLNPMASVVECYRWSLLNTDPPSAAMIGISTLVAFTMLVTGAWYFRSMERSFADLI
jgi:lipopolysaccharide transport system permease protein